MKIRSFPFVHHSILTIGALVAGTALSHGQTWTGNGADNNWSTAGNWSAPLVNNGNAALIFDGSNRLTPNMDANWAINTLTFSANASGFTLNGANTLSLGANTTSSATVLTNNSSFLQTINSNLVLGASNTNANQTYSFTSASNAPAGTLTINGNIDAGIHRLSIQASSGSTVTINGNISGSRIGSPTSNSAANQTLTMGSANVTYILAGNNTFTGNVYNQRGTVLLRSNTALGAAPNVTLSANASNSSPVMLIDGAYTIDRNFYVGSSTDEFASNTITMGGNTSHVSTFSGNIQLGNNLTNGGGKNLNVTAVAGGTVHFSGNLTTFNSDGKDSLTKIGEGTVVISGTGNTYSGSTNVTAGTLLINSSYAASGALISVSANAQLGGLATIDRAISVGSGGILLGGDGTTGSTLSVNNNVTLGDGSVISLALGGAGAHSILARVGGSWTFDLTEQAILFTDLGATVGVYNNLLTGLSIDPGVTDWKILNEGWEGAFSYANGSVNLSLTAVPEPSVVALTALGISALLLRLRRKISA